MSATGYYDKGIKYGATSPYNGNTYPTKISKNDVNVPFNPDSFYIENNFSPLSNGDIYLNMRVRNDTTKIQPAKYYNNLMDDLVSIGNQYKLTVSRMDAPSVEIPIFFQQITGDDRFVISIVTIDNIPTEEVGVADCQYVPVQSEEILNTFQSPNQYPVWQVNQIVRSINDAVNTACNSFPVDHPLNLANAADRDANRPRLLYDDNSLKFSWIFPAVMSDSGGAIAAEYADLTWLDTATGNAEPNATMKLFTNKKLDYLFENFSKIEYDESQYVGANKSEVYIRPYNMYNNLTTLSGTQFWVMEQCHQTVNLWYDLYKIVIISNILPIRHEYIDNRVSSNGQSRELDGKGVLIDIDVAFEVPNYQRISYAPFEFKWIDILTDSGINKIDWQIFYLTQNGNLLPLYLEPNQTCNLKLLLRRK